MVNRTIAANVPFSIPANTWAAYASTATQLYISADGEHWTADTQANWSGNKFFTDTPRTCWFKVDNEITVSY